MKKTYRELLQLQSTSGACYAFAFGTLDALIELWEKDIVDQVKLRREAFQLRCAMIARLDELKRQSRDDAMAAQILVRNRIYEGNAVPRKSVEQVVEKDDGVVQP